jgi:hypothetical protein
MVKTLLAKVVWSAVTATVLTGLAAMPGKGGANEKKRPPLKRREGA